MRRRAAALEPLVGYYLDNELAAENDPPAGTPPGSTPAPDQEDPHEA
jgi:hypothetical protein